MDFKQLIIVVALIAHACAQLADGTTIQLWPCQPGSLRQQWTLDPNYDDAIVLTAFPDMCLDISTYTQDPEGAKVWLWSCHLSQEGTNQMWSFNADNNTITTRMPGEKCLAVNSEEAFMGVGLSTWTCNASSLQSWVYSSSDGTIRSKLNTSMCLDAGDVLTCQDPPLNTMAFCNTSLGYEERAADLVSRFSLEEKYTQFGTTAGSVARLGVPAYQWWSEGLHGLGYSPGITFAGKLPYATSFPQICGMGATFNLSLVNAMAGVISTEARAFATAGQAGLTFFLPNINVYRDPRWGRGQETAGEDPFVLSQYVNALVTGLQEGEDSRYFKIITTCKHFTAYDLEDWDGVDRYHFDAIVADQDLVESFLPPFESCVKDAHAGSIMCSYNSVNGIPSCANSGYNNGIIREQWGWQGYMVSDCGAIDCIQYTHNYTHNVQDTCAAGINGGCDLDCGNFYQSYMQYAIGNATLTENDIDASLIRLFSHRIQLGFFDPLDDQPMAHTPPSVVNTDASQELALDASRQSMVLLQNPNGILPWSVNDIATLAVIGPNANATTTMQGNYYGAAPYLISPVDGFGAFANVTFEFGCSVNSTDDSLIPDAVAAAQAADATVLVIGIDQTIESEGHDRTSLALPGEQWNLVNQVVAAARGPVAVVVMSGGPIDLTPLLSMNVAVMWCGYPGQSGGQAIAETVFGVNNPGGRLPYTIYPAEFVDQISMFNMSFRAWPGRGYRFYTGDAVFTFGTGLSYTTFTYQWANPAGPDTPVISLTTTDVERAWRARGEIRFPEVAGARSSPPLGDDVSYRVNITNTGSVAGDDVVLSFITYTDDPDAPMKQLIGFARVSLQPGEMQQVFFAPEADAFTTVDAAARKSVHPGIYRVVIGNLEKIIKVTGEPRVLFDIAEYSL